MLKVSAQRTPANYGSLIRLFIPCAVAALVLISLPVLVIATGGVFSLTKHGDPATGVQRNAALPRGDCAQCHVSHSGQAFALFTANSNGLCMSSCSINISGALSAYQGPALYDVS